MSQAKCLTFPELLGEIRVKAQIESNRSGKLLQRWVAQLFYTTVHELFSLNIRDKKLADRVAELFYWSDEFRYNTEIVDKDDKLTAALLTAMQPFEKEFWMFREAWRYVEFKNEFGKDLWFYEVVNYLKAKELYGAPYFMRVSRDSPELWVYTESAEHGRADRQVKTKLGKLLTKLLPQEGAAGIQRVATYFQNAGAMGVQFARTDKECFRVYADGPQSCMKGQESTRCYGSPDLAVAYVTDINGRITARTVCNMIKKHYTRVYGNADGIQPALEKMGFKRGDLNGCRLKTIWYNDSSNMLVAPWVDIPEAGLMREGKVQTGYTRLHWDKDTETLTIDSKGELAVGNEGRVQVPTRTEKGRAYSKANPVMQPVAGVQQELAVAA